MVKAIIEQYNLDIDTFRALSLLQPQLNGDKFPHSFYKEHGNIFDANVLLNMLELICTGKLNFVEINLFQKNRIMLVCHGNHMNSNISCSGPKC